jgi:acetyl esterase/lipase
MSGPIRMDKDGQKQEKQMLRKTINYSTDCRVNMETFIHEEAGNPRPAIIVLPGGAYGWLSDTEKEPAALTFYERGFHTFILNYSVGVYSEYPNPLNEASWAIWEIRRTAKEWGINPDGIVLMGFSAGSGVAGISATQWNIPGLYEMVGAPDAGAVRPDAAVIGYGCADNTNTILDNPKVIKPANWGKIVTDRTPQLDFVNYVSPGTPPMFIWHNRYDKYVPTENPLMLAAALQKNDLPYELHIFQEGYHGMSVGNNNPGGNLENSEYPNVDMWVPMCVNWLNCLFN